VEDEDEEAADPVAVELPEGVPLPCEEFEGVAVGAGDAASRECQIMSGKKVQAE
jgi:hypothetical protein